MLIERLKILALLGAVMISLGACSSCDDELKSPHIVDVSPLTGLTLSGDAGDLRDLLASPGFDSYNVIAPGRYYEKQYKYREADDDSIYSHISVRILLSSDIHSARNSFTNQCEHLWLAPDLGDFIFGESEDNQYCISYVRQGRADSAGLCTPLGYYYSFIVFQKGHLVITITEQTSEKTSTKQDSVIRELAQALGSQSQD